VPLEPRVRLIVGLLSRLDGEADRTVPMVERRFASAALARRGKVAVMHRGAEPAEAFDRQVPVERGSIRVRFLRPDGAGPHPLYVFFHGGGWCVGTLAEREPRCRAISAGAGCVVASVDYRMAPENQYPTAPEDCYAAVSWMVEHAEELGIDPGRVAVGGESAGGNLAAAVCLMARDRGGPAICHQWLDVPALDATLSTPGHREVPDGYLLDADSIDEYLDLYVPDRDRRREPYCSPLLAADHAGLPPAWILTCEFDKLRGDGEAYAAALRSAGVRVTHTRLAGHVHPSFAFTRWLPSAVTYERDAIAALAAAFAR
jgi:acetyl esterase